MKASLITAVAFALSVQGHCILQDIICQKQGTTSDKVIDVSPGDEIGAYFGHVIGGAQFANDPDNSIAKSHKGPVIAWLAKVDEAASASKTGLEWFKIWEDTFDPSSKQWGVDNIIPNQGWVKFDMPQCIAAGDYLMRVEILALHTAKNSMAAQFYMSCAQLRVGGNGTFSPSQTFSFPGAYQQSDPSIVINIYGLAGQPDNGGKPYSAPDKAPVIQC